MSSTAQHGWLFIAIILAAALVLLGVKWIVDNINFDTIFAKTREKRQKAADKTAEKKRLADKAAKAAAEEAKRKSDAARTAGTDARKAAKRVTELDECCLSDKRKSPRAGKTPVKKVPAKKTVAKKPPAKATVKTTVTKKTVVKKS